MSHEPLSSPKNPELGVFPETLTELNETLNTFLNNIVLPTRVNDEEEDGWSIRHYETTLTDGDAHVAVSGFVLFHDKFGIVQRPILKITRGKLQDNGYVRGSDFEFSIGDSAIWGDTPLTIDDDTGRVISGSTETYSFTDNFEIQAREAALLDDVTFGGEGTSEGVVVPQLEVSPDGDIHEVGVQEATEKRLIGGATLGLMISFENEEARRVHERQMAARKQALEEVGTVLTTERAERVIDLLARLQAEREG